MYQTRAFQLNGYLPWLSEHEKKCTDHDIRKATDSTMPRYFLIKTLSLLVGAEDDDWEKAEV